MNPRVTETTEYLRQVLGKQFERDVFLPPPSASECLTLVKLFRESMGQTSSSQEQLRNYCMNSLRRKPRTREIIVVRGYTPEQAWVNYWITYLMHPPAMAILEKFALLQGHAQFVDAFGQNLSSTTPFAREKALELEMAKMFPVYDKVITVKLKSMFSTRTNRLVQDGWKELRSRKESTSFPRLVQEGLDMIAASASAREKFSHEHKMFVCYLACLRAKEIGKLYKEVADGKTGLAGKLIEAMRRESTAEEVATARKSF